MGDATGFTSAIRYQHFMTREVDGTYGQVGKVTR